MKIALLVLILLAAGVSACMPPQVPPALDRPLYFEILGRGQSLSGKVGKNTTVQVPEQMYFWLGQSEKNNCFRWSSSDTAVVHVRELRTFHNSPCWPLTYLTFRQEGKATVKVLWTDPQRGNILMGEGRLEVIVSK